MVYSFLTYLGTAVFLTAFWFFVRYIKNKWAEDYNIVFYSDIRDIKLCRIYALSITTDTAHHKEVEVTVYGRGIFVRYPHQDVPVVKFKAEWIDEVNLIDNKEVKIVSRYKYTLVDYLVVCSDSHEDLVKLARSAETLLRLHKRKNKKPDPLLKKRIRKS